MTIGVNKNRPGSVEYDGRTLTIEAFVASYLPAGRAMGADPCVMA